MSCQLWGWTLPWAALLLLLGPHALSYNWHLHDGSDCDEGYVIKYYFPATVEYALHVFNEKSRDVNAYRLVHVLNSWREQIGYVLAFSMELLLRRTTCGKLEEDIDNCPFQETADLNNTFTCFFTVSTEPWEGTFELLHKKCLVGFH
ncbi:PREDICTED: cystatin-9-like [Condylura cristata]|uniref:cystatin-9-like n=1 Tax=Condylura cristata TaxID=143302 RepID=UPI0003346411|nr:PREDICTED: cystatin-9-like [Condylura cristata]